LIQAEARRLKLNLALSHAGKVRDVYRIDQERLLMVASDRLSAFDVILPDPIPGKGEILTRLSNFWFAALRDHGPNHLLDTPVSEALGDPTQRAWAEPRAVVVRALNPLPIEAVVRGYLAGSGLKDYQRDGAISGVHLPAGLRLADALPEPIFTPSSKAAVGEHDEPITFDQMAARIGAELAEEVRARSLALYRAAHAHAAVRGILIADTKFEFGLDARGALVWMDEALTPDSSRFWDASGWQPGHPPPSFDKQFVRDHLELIGWNKKPPAPHLPLSVIVGTQARYREALDRLTAPV
jgi:phosphoribosylaminoimidazole-succinocarboxamide synthase